MKVNKDSWHYKVWASGKSETHLIMYDLGHYKANLCPYFWVVVFKVLWWSLFSALMLAAAGILIWGLFWNTQVGLALLAGVAIVWFPIKRVTKWIDKKAMEPPKPPGLVRNFLTAKKQQMCPQIEFVSKVE